MFYFVLLLLLFIGTRFLSRLVFSKEYIVDLMHRVNFDDVYWTIIEHHFIRPIIQIIKILLNILLDNILNTNTKITVDTIFNTKEIIIIYKKL
jgi:hypothetical protein